MLHGPCGTLVVEDGSRRRKPPDNRYPDVAALKYPPPTIKYGNDHGHNACVFR